MAKKSIFTVDERTDAIIERWRGLPEEYGMLKGLLCAAIAIEEAARAKGADFEVCHREGTVIDQHINRYKIAERMDEMRKAALQAPTAKA